MRLDEFSFDESDFVENFWKKAMLKPELAGVGVKGICEENLTGHFWTGRNSDTLLKRMNKYFGKPKIIMCIRRQDKAVASLYSNYIKNGGTLSLKRLLNDVCFEGYLLKYKLSYDKLIEKYQNVFGKDNLFVYTYEEFTEQPIVVINKICDFLGVSHEYDLPVSKKPNKGRGKIGLYIERWLSIFGLNGRVGRKLIDYILIRDFSVSDKNIEKLIEKDLVIWKESNRRTQELLDIDLSSYSYPM